MVNKACLSLPVVCLTATALMVIVSGQIPGRADTITKGMLREDPRLEKPVSIDARRTYVGQLLERLSAQTGVELSANERDGAADAKVAVFVYDVPLGTVLDALWSLLSYKNAVYSWQREKRNGTFVYRLARPLAAQQFPDFMQAEVQSAFEAEAAAKQELLEHFPRDVERQARKDRFAADLAGSQKDRDALRILFSSVRPETRARLLRGEVRHRVQVSDLSADARAFIHKTWSDYNGVQILPDGTRAPVPEPSFIEFYVRKGPLATPSLFAMIEGIGAYVYLGGVPLQRKVHNRLFELWQLPGDHLTDPSEKTNLSLLQVGSDEPTSDGDSAFDQLLNKRLRELSSEAHVPIIARLPRRINSSVRDMGDPCRKTLGEYLAKLTEQLPPHLMNKWRSGVLLFTHLGWYREPEPAPWRLAKIVLAAKSATKDHFSAADLIQIAGKLTEAELNSLSQDVPVLKAVARWNALFARLAGLPELAKLVLSEQGAPISELEDALASISDFALVMHKPDLNGSHVRMIDSDEQGGVVLVKVFSADGKDLGGAGFANRRRKRD